MGALREREQVLKLTWGHIMRIYKVKHYDTDTGEMLVEWFANQDEAEARLDALKSGAMDPVEIPTNRLGIVKWLNENYTREM